MTGHFAFSCLLLPLPPLCRKVHPLLDVFFAHPQHPFRRSVRRLHLLSITFLTFVVAALSELLYGDISVSSPYRIKYVVVSNLVLIVYDFLLRELGSCTCCSAGGSFEKISKHCGCYNCCVQIGGFMFTTFVVSTAILFLASFGILLAEKQFSLFFVQFFLLVKAINYGSYFFVSVIWFAWERNRQRRSWENGEVTPMYPYGPRLPTTKYFAASWRFCECNSLRDTSTKGKLLVGSIDSNVESHQDSSTSSPLHGECGSTVDKISNSSTAAVAMPIVSTSLKTFPLSSTFRTTEFISSNPPPRMGTSSSRGSAFSFSRIHSEDYGNRNARTLLPEFLASKISVDRKSSINGGSGQREAPVYRGAGPAAQRLAARLKL